MITNEEFKKCADLCDKRLALLRMSKEINEVINNPPMTNEEVSGNFYYEHKSCLPYWKTAIITFIVFYFAFPILGILCFSYEVSVWSSFIISGILATIAGIIRQSKYRDKIKKECDNLIVENTNYLNEYYRLLPEYKSFGNEVNNSIISVTEEIVQMNAIPEKYWEVASELWYFVTVHEAEDYREAVRIWEDIQHKMAVEDLAREQVYYAQVAADYAEESREYAYQSMVASQNAERNSDISLLLNTYTAYKVS